MKKFWVIGLLAAAMLCAAEEPPVRAQRIPEADYAALKAARDLVAQIERKILTDLAPEALPDTSFAETADCGQQCTYTPSWAGPWLVVAQTCVDKCVSRVIPDVTGDFDIGSFRWVESFGCGGLLVTGADGRWRCEGATR